MSLRSSHIPSGICVALCLSTSIASAQHTTERPVVTADTVEEVEEIASGVDLKLLSMKPLPGGAHSSLDMMEVMIANAGTDTSDVARLSVQMSRAHEKGRKLAGRATVPRIPPGEKITVRIRVPKSKDTETCYTGMLDFAP